ncbi:hypothetical protein I552_8714 [Mycobacterium xenopi 3993]|nr:hypothetical protein I552_8714 [Mycobacterium xenopi 3993]
MFLRLFANRQDEERRGDAKMLCRQLRDPPSHPDVADAGS